jgi:hypothetical protein
MRGWARNCHAIPLTAKRGTVLAGVPRVLDGFCHRANAQLNWNPDLRIYIDYEFLLRCVDLWGRAKFAINPVVLVDYIQTNQGIIGQSNYQDWAKELEWMVKNYHLYSCLSEGNILALNSLKDKYLLKHQEVQQIAAFVN